MGDPCATLVDVHMNINPGVICFHTFRPEILKKKKKMWCLVSSKALGIFEIMNPKFSYFLILLYTYI